MPMSDLRAPIAELAQSILSHGTGHHAPVQQLYTSQLPGETPGSGPVSARSTALVNTALFVPPLQEALLNIPTELSSAIRDMREEDARAPAEPGPQASGPAPPPAPLEVVSDSNGPTDRTAGVILDANNGFTIIQRLQADTPVKYDVNR